MARIKCLRCGFIGKIHYRGLESINYCKKCGNSLQITITPYEIKLLCEELRGKYIKKVKKW